MACGEVKEYLCLNRVGILKFVDQKVAVAVVDMFYEFSAFSRILFQHITQIYQVVIESELAASSEFFGNSKGSRDNKVHGNGKLEALNSVYEKRILTIIQFIVGKLILCKMRYEKMLKTGTKLFKFKGSRKPYILKFV